MKRYLSFLLVAFVIRLACPKAADAATATPHLDAQHPNVLIIMTDDQDTDNLGCYGGEAYTPNIDRLAANGVRFANANVTASVCTPSRYGTITGRNANRCTERTYLAQFPADQPAHPSFWSLLERTRSNIGKSLTEAGYSTGFVGKFHLTRKPLLNGNKGWEKAGLEMYPKDADMRKQAISEALKHNQDFWCNEIRGFGYEQAFSIYSANTRELFLEQLNVHNIEWTLDGAMKFLNMQTADKPFFLHFNVTVPHGPHPAIKKDGKYPYSIDADMRMTGEGYKPEGFDVMPSRDTLIPRTLAAGKPESIFHALWMDDAVGALMNKLKAMGVADNTLIIYSSDHGLHRERTHSMGKATLYEPGLRVPLIMHWPAGINKPGRVHEGLVANIDIAPTIHDVTHTPLPAKDPMDGISLGPVLRGDDKPVRTALMCELGYAKCVKTADWKYLAIRYPQEIQDKIDKGEKFPGWDFSVNKPVGRMSQKPVMDRPFFFDHTQLSARAMQSWPEYLTADQLYDLKNDPGETTNIFQSNPRQAQAMKVLMGQQILQHSDRAFGEFSASHTMKN
jgi:arylsulfatase A-like enzyme